MRSSHPLSFFRTHLPPFETDQDLIQFLDQGFTPQLSSNFYPQLVFTTVVLCILVFLGALTTISRLYKKVFWVFKIEYHKSGKLIVFNTTNVFTTFQLFFIGAFEAMLWVIFEMSEGNLSPANFLFPLLLPWLALISGAHLSVAGTYIACRQILSTSPSSASETSYLSASVVNTLTFALPILCAFFSVPLAIVSGFKWRKAYHKFETFRELLLSSPSTSPTEEERDQAAVIWRDFAESWRTSSIGFLIWTIVAVFFTLLVVVFGSYLIRSLNRHLQECRLDSNRMYEHEQTVTAYFPKREVPESAREHGKAGRITSKAKRVVLSSAIKLIMFLGLGICVGATGSAAIAGFLAGRMYELTCISPRGSQVAISRVLLSIMYLIVLAGSFTFTLISISAFSPILENYTEKRRMRRGTRSRSGSESQSQSFSKTSKAMNRLIELLPVKLKNEILAHRSEEREEESSGVVSGSRSGIQLSSLERNTRANAGQVKTFQELESGIWRENWIPDQGSVEDREDRGEFLSPLAKSGSEDSRIREK